jgi:hypothetical protein
MKYRAEYEREVRWGRQKAIRTWFVMFVPYIIITGVTAFMTERKVSLLTYVLLHLGVNLFFVAAAYGIYRKRKADAFLSWTLIDSGYEADGK